MSEIYIYSFGSVVLVSLLSLVGIFTLSLNENTLKKYIFLLVSLAAGALLGDAFIHLIPEVFENPVVQTQAPILIISGILIFFLLEKFLHWHHHAIEDHGQETVHPTGRMILISDGVHNFIDGLIIAVGYMASIEIGTATTLAVILHEIPQEIGDFGVLLHSGYTKKRAIWLNFLSALFAILGAAVAIIIGNSTSNLIYWLLPITAGGFIYIALSDLMPELHKTKTGGRSVFQFIALLAGIGAMILLLTFE
ncbi:MAG: hypothetical protein A2741_01995 [Candidatus Zambryskibacteria bacterium RIFCSPHIGHO2_01_FULL_43_27]|uniref:ZIP family metal transporter n=1 Tax=Candidatus Zambryskibacteria bacterium RIFCSPLOWO2_01_FULL_43_17 TaxID=1802760 RepID=A0A1G2U2V1_9BACT|nr:MAG: hypothetical protein A2741_01995 [Candidatus Zambryskibacteria bacterium RIFCSPHIGHO2_01_FULL_43_27]OHA99785.1 MAG: hypothetical protein A3E93_00940 [Candidatus Zambryskibacteria bacterium RIFCSPHIGHO2_12_FULL_43_12b]OHB03210.1 MAG: hypothetical protein A2920_02480 [Candidatus Zambryskibacteria bacterium RIFCSPLOWO2_01_FULL_43_17]